MLYVIVTYECTRAIMKIHQADIFSPSKNDPSVSLDLGLEHRIVIRESLSGNIEWADSLMLFIKFFAESVYEMLYAYLYIKSDTRNTLNSLYGWLRGVRTFDQQHLQPLHQSTEDANRML